MLWVRKGALVFAAVLAVVFLLSAALDSGVVRVVGNPAPIKRTLADSGIYKSIIPSTLDEIDKDTASDGEVPFSDPLVVSAAEATFSGPYLQSTTEGVIDSIYRWLDGKDSVPDFKIDLSVKKTEFANKVAAGVKKRLNGLPVCTGGQSGQFDAFRSKCRPAGVSAQQAAGTVKRQIANSNDFLNDAVLSASDIKSADSNQPFFSGNAKDVPEIYQRFKTSPLVLAVLAFLALAGVLLLSQPKLSGLKHAGLILLGVGIFVFLFGLAVDQTIDNKLLTQINLDNAVLQNNLRQLAADLSQRTTNSYLSIGGVYAALGAASMAAYYIARRRRV
jgi:hypothetical protein